MCPPQNKTSPPFKRVRIVPYDSILTQRKKLSKQNVFSAHLLFYNFDFKTEVKTNVDKYMMFFD